MDNGVHPGDVVADDREQMFVFFFAGGAIDQQVGGVVDGAQGVAISCASVADSRPKEARFILLGFLCNTSRVFQKKQRQRFMAGFQLGKAGAEHRALL